MMNIPMREDIPLAAAPRGRSAKQLYEGEGNPERERIGILVSCLGRTKIPRSMLRSSQVEQKIGYLKCQPPRWVDVHSGP
jgi:hypothetical protein